MEEDKFTITIQDNNLTVDMPEVAFYVEGIQIAKRGIAMDIQKFLPEIAETKFIETFKAEPKPAQAATTSPTPAPAPESQETEEAKEAEREEEASTPNTPQ